MEGGGLPRDTLQAENELLLQTWLDVQGALSLAVKYLARHFYRACHLSDPLHYAIPYLSLRIDGASTTRFRTVLIVRHLAPGEHLDHPAWVGAGVLRQFGKQAITVYNII